ncbi:MAG: peptidylprolyl isomerase [Firmicutes bacterium]|nr:peptidylprolyl isomerase [Bacillota bacterium]
MNRSGKVLFLFLCLLLIVLLPIAAGCGKKGEGKVTDKNIVAVVNGEEISRKDLDKTLELFFGKKVLDTLVDMKLLEQAAKKANVSVTDAEIKEKIDELKPQFAQYAFLGQPVPSDEQIKFSIYPQLLMSKLLMKDIPEQKFKDYFDKNKDKLIKIKISRIAAKDEKSAEDILKKLEGGADFAETAKKESIDIFTKDNGGEMGYVQKKMLKGKLDPVVQAAFETPVGKLSGIIKDGKQFYIIKVGDKKDTLEQLKMDILPELMAKDAVTKLMADLKKQAKIQTNLQ